MKPNSVSYIERFDKLIEEDSTLVKTSYEGENLSQKKIETVNLKYEPNQVYSRIFIERVICSKDIDEELKLDFVRVALKDSPKNIFKFFYEIDCPCLQKQHKLATLFTNYYQRISSTTNDKYKKHQYLEFIVRNNFSNSKELIDQYFLKRSNLKERRYVREVNLPVYLIKGGYVEEALSIARIFIKECTIGKLLNIDGEHYRKENLFALLYFYGNPKVKKEIKDLAFRYSELRGFQFANSNLNLFLKYVDLNRYKKSVEKWLKEYESSDPNNYYCSLLASDGKLIAETLGFKYWKIFLRSKPNWKEHERRFDEVMISVSVACMNGIKSKVEKKEIIDYILNNNRYFKSDETSKESRFLRQFHQLLLAYKPSISDLEIESYLPERYKKYGAWKYSLEHQKIRESFENSKHKLIDRIKIFKKYGFYLDFEIDEYDIFIDSIGRLNSYDLLFKTQNLIWFDTEAGKFPVNNLELFNSYFKSVLFRNNITYLSLSEVHNLKDNLCTYCLEISGKNKSYKSEYEDNTDWYQVSHLTNLINLALKESGSNLRLIFILTGDQTTSIGLFDPNKFLPLAKELDIVIYATHYDDGLMKQN